MLVSYGIQLTALLRQSVHGKSVDRALKLGSNTFQLNPRARIAKSIVFSAVSLPD
jgi:hypothetical protein